MAEIPQFQDSQPVISPSHVASEGEGLEHFAKALGGLSQTTGEITAELEKDKSQAMYIHSVANLEQLKTTSHIRMMENPGDAPRIAEDMRSATDMVKKMAYVNSQDRSRLNYYASGAQNSIDLLATEAQVKQNQLAGAYTHFENWPSQMSAYFKTLLSDHDQAEELKNGMLSTLHGLVMTRSITPEQAGSSIKMMQHAVDLAKAYHDYAASGDHSAIGYQTLAANPFNTGADLAGTPVNAHSAWQTDYYSNDKSLQGALAATYERKIVPADVYLSLKPAQQERLALTKLGVMEADGLINAGTSFAAIEAMHKELGESGKVLSYKDHAKKNALGVFIEDLKNGNYLSTIGRTPMGGKIMQEFVARDAAIKSAQVDDSQKLSLMNQNKNDSVSNLVSLGQGLHIPGELIRPVSQTDLANMESGFKAGQDPAQTLETFNQYTKQNQSYVANSMKNPSQRLIMQAIGYADKVTPQSKLDIITANQDGRHFPIDLKAHKVKEEDLKNTTYSSLSDQLRFLSRQYDPDQAQLLQSAMVSSTIKYAKYLAAKDNNLAPTQSQMDGYIKQASKMYQESFKQISGLNYIVNANQIPGHLGKPELDHLAEYVTNKAYDNLKAGRSEAEFLAATRSNPLMMTFSPTNDVQAVDANGTVYFSTPYNEHLLSAAIFAKNKKRKEAEEKGSKEPSNLVMGIDNAD